MEVAWFDCSDITTLLLIPVMPRDHQRQSSFAGKCYTNMEDNICNKEVMDKIGDTENFFTDGTVSN